VENTDTGNTNQHTSSEGSTQMKKTITDLCSSVDTASKWSKLGLNQQNQIIFVWTHPSVITAGHVWFAILRHIIINLYILRHMWQISKHQLVIGLNKKQECQSVVFLTEPWMSMLNQSGQTEYFKLLMPAYTPANLLWLSSMVGDFIDINLNTTRLTYNEPTVAEIFHFGLRCWTCPAVENYSWDPYY